MGSNKRIATYRSFSYLPTHPVHGFALAAELDRTPARPVELSTEQQTRLESLLADTILISLHEHLGVFPDDIAVTPEYARLGRMATAFEGLAASHWDCAFDNLLDGICQIHSQGGWKWSEVIHDLGMRLCDIAQQDLVIHCRSINDIYHAHDTGRIAWVASMEGAAMIENELDRIDLLFGLGVRALGITYSESNALGSGLRETRDGGLTVFGRQAVERMNRVGMLIDCSHCGDQTTLDAIEVSEHPILLSHIGARALWNSNRLAPDEVLEACARKGGVIGIEAAPHTTLSPNHTSHSLESVMDHFEYIKSKVGIDHVSFGPDCVYGDHVGLHALYSASLSISQSRANQLHRTADGNPPFDMVPYVRGLENPTEGSINIPAFLIKSGYSDEEIAKVMGGNALRLLEQVWPQLDQRPARSDCGRK